MSIIQQYALTSNYCKADLPADAIILGAQKVRNSICFWAEFDEKKPVVKRSFMAFPTGVALPVILAPKFYIDTVQMGDVSWHIYEIKE